MSRIYTDTQDAQGDAWASQVALPNQTFWQASLPTLLFSNWSIRFTNDPTLALDTRRWFLFIRFNSSNQWLKQYEI